MSSLLESSLTNRQLETFVICSRIASGLSGLGVIAIIVTFCLSPRFRNPLHRLIFINAFYTLFDAGSILISRNGPDAGDGSALCQAQAFLNQMFPLADVLWTLVMAVDVYLIVFHRYDARALKRLEWKYIVGVTVVTLLPAATLLFTHSGDGGLMYGSAIIWCAIVPGESIARIVSYYVPIWLSIFVTLALYCRIGIEIIKRRRALVSITNDSVQLDETVLPPYPALDSTPSSPPLTIVNIHQDHPQPYCSQSAINPTPKQINTPTTISTISQTSLKPSSSLSFRQYIIMPLLFAITLFSVWVPSTVNRIISSIDHSYSSFPLLVVVCITCSLRGFWNGIVFVAVGRGSRKRGRDEEMIPRRRHR